MIRRLNPEFASPFLYTPIPGTGLYDFCEENELILNKDKTIERTGVFVPTLKNVNYGVIENLLTGLKGD